MAHHLIARDALGSLTKLGQGGQGVVYQAPKVKVKFAASMVFKEYKPQTRQDVSFDALAQMPKLVEEILPNHDGQGVVSIASWPCALVESDTGPVGFVMPAIPDSFYIDLTTVKGRSKTTAEFQHLLNEPSVLTARGIAITDRQRYQLLREVAKSLSFFHRIGVCVGDISPKNVLWSLQPRPAIYFVDCDTMRVNGVSALPQMETPGWEVPAGEELATIYSDTYKLGLLALRLLVGDQNTRNPQDLPPTTPKPLRQLITDTLTKKPDHRPLPEAWAYLLGHVIDEAQQNANDSPADRPKPALPTHTPEPTPVVRSRTAPPTPTPAPLSTGLVLTSAQKASLYGVAGVVLLLLIVVAALISSSSQGSNTKASSRSSSSNSTYRPTPSATTTTPPSPTQSMSPVEREIRNASVGDCFRQLVGPEKADGNFEVLTLTPKGCGSAGSEIRVVSKQFFSTETPPPCETYSDSWLTSGGQNPQVLLCYVWDTPG